MSRPLPSVRGDLFVRYPGSDEHIPIGSVDIPLKPAGHHSFEVITDTRQIREFVQQVYLAEAQEKDFQ